MSDPQTPTLFLAPDIAQLAPLFPGYEIEFLIATGGMGAVYSAVQKSLDRTVAIKILPREFSKDAAFCASFEAEAKAMARLNHPNLISVYDFGEVDGMLYIIMEFVPGKSLFHSAHGIAIDPGEVIRLVTGICNGLAHAHSHGIIHRDIKPSNVLLDLDAHPKIGDFGLAHPVGRNIAEGEEIFGTPHYTAPEVVNAPQSVSHRTDIFSVGVLLHELLTGRLPGDHPQPASTIVHCDLRFDAIIRRATNPVPELRYASAEEIAKDLRAIAISSGPGIPHPPVRTVAHHPSLRRPTKAAPTQNSFAFPLIVILSLVIVITTAVIYYFSRPRESPNLTSNEPTAAPATTSPSSPQAIPVIPLVKPKPIPEPTPRTDTKPEHKPEPKPEPKPAPPPCHGTAPPGAETRTRGFHPAQVRCGGIPRSRPRNHAGSRRTVARQPRCQPQEKHRVFR
jgi:serine/threonine protein kinase